MLEYWVAMVCSVCQNFDSEIKYQFFTENTTHRNTKCPCNSPYKMLRFLISLLVSSDWGRTGGYDRKYVNVDRWLGRLFVTDGLSFRFLIRSVHRWRVCDACYFGNFMYPADSMFPLQYIKHLFCILTVCDGWWLKFCTNFSSYSSVVSRLTNHSFFIH